MIPAIRFALWCIKYCSRQWNYWLVRIMLLCCELKVTFIGGIIKTFLSCIVYSFEREWELSKLSFFLLRCGLRALLTHNIYRWQVYVYVMYSLYILMQGAWWQLCAQHSQLSYRGWMRRHSTFKVQISSVNAAWYFASYLMKLEVSVCG